MRRMRNAVVAFGLAALSILGILGGRAAPGGGTIPASVLPASPSTVLDIQPQMASTEPLREVRMVDDRLGWATGIYGHVLRTTDGGVTWYQVGPSWPSYAPEPGPSHRDNVTAFLLDNAEVAWFLDARMDTVYRTLDGGRHWQKGTPPKLAITDLGTTGPRASGLGTIVPGPPIPGSAEGGWAVSGASLAFISEQQGWLLVSSGEHRRRGELFRTTDGGLTWRAVSRTGTATNALPYGGDIVFSPAVKELGWLRPDPEASDTSPPPLYVTRDGGRTWAPQPLPPRVFNTESPPQFYYGLPQFTPSVVSVPHGVSRPFPANSFDGLLPVTVASGGSHQALFYTTHDGGATWAFAGHIAATGTDTWQFTSIVDEKTFWDYVPDSNTLWVTRDGGKTWTSLQPRPALDRPTPWRGAVETTQIAFVSPERGWAVLNGSLLRTADGGRTWQAVWGGNPIWVTFDQGTTWTDVTPVDWAGDSYAMTSGYFMDEKAGLAFRLYSGKDLTVCGTEDGGRSWSTLATVPVKTGDGNMSVAFADAQRGWVLIRSAGMGQHSGELLRTTDGGRTWELVAKGGWASEMPFKGTPGELPFGGTITVQPDGTLWLNGGQRASGGGPGFLYLFKSVDGGRSWSEVRLEAPAGHEEDTTNVSQPAFFGRLGFIAVNYNGRAGNSNVLYVTGDSGKTWSVRGSLNVGNWPAFAGPDEGWQTNGQEVFHTTDGGRTWQAVNPDVSLSQALEGRFISTGMVFPNPLGPSDPATRQRSTTGHSPRYLIFLESKTDHSEPRLRLATDDGGESWTVLEGGVRGPQ